MIILLFFIFFKCLSIFEFSFARSVFRIMSQIPDFYIYVIILFVTSKSDPKFAVVVVSVYFVCESKLGFSIKQLINILIWFLIWNGFIAISLAFFFKFGIIFSTIWSMIWFTCDPPLVVQIPLTNENCWNWPYDFVTITLHLFDTMVSSKIKLSSSLAYIIT